jgi:predicted PurR-regulated permease PerM
MVIMSGKTFFTPQHELHKRRFSRNLGLGLVLAAFVALVFGLTVVKVTRGEIQETFSQQTHGGQQP